MTDEQLNEWAALQAQDKGELARELVKLRASLEGENRRLREALEKIALRHEDFPEKRDGYGSMAVMIARAALRYAAPPASGETVTERWAKSFEAPPPPPTQGEEEHATIWLQPWCAGCEQHCGSEGRQWCQDDVWDKCEECGKPSVRFELVPKAALRQRADEATRAALAAEPATDPPRAKQSTTGDPWADVRDEATKAENEACAELAERNPFAQALDIAFAIRARIAP